MSRQPIAGPSRSHTVNVEQSLTGDMAGPSGSNNGGTQDQVTSYSAPVDTPTVDEDDESRGCYVPRHSVRAAVDLLEVLLPHAARDSKEHQVLVKLTSKLHRTLLNARRA
jgi:hypothetical protein